VLEVDTTIVSEVDSLDELESESDELEDMDVELEAVK
jgi:hypothetical protein